jgi:hypothetical protein
MGEGRETGNEGLGNGSESKVGCLMVFGSPLIPDWVKKVSLAVRSFEENGLRLRLIFLV